MTGVAGSTETIVIQTRSTGGGNTPYTNVFTDEPLVCEIWPGEDRASSATLPASWNSGPAGKIDLAFPLDVMTDLEPGLYNGAVLLADSSTLLAAFALNVVHGPGGTATAPKVYSTYADLLDELPWLTQLQGDANDQTGFADARRDARTWLDGIILGAVPTCRYFRSTALSWDWNFDTHGTSQTSILVAEALAADQLMITSPSGLRLVKACTYYALATILRRCAGQKSTSDLIALSSYYSTMANNTVLACRAEIDVNADGRPEYVILLGRTNTL